MDVAHIGRAGHNVTPQEVEEVIFSDQTLIKRSRNGRYLFLGPTGAGRILAAVLDPEGNGVWFCVSARSASQDERKLYRNEMDRRSQP